jgi:uncharacterized membrane protein
MLVYRVASLNVEGELVECFGHYLHRERAEQVAERERVRIESESSYDRMYIFQVRVNVEQ